MLRAATGMVRRAEAAPRARVGPARVGPAAAAGAVLVGLVGLVVLGGCDRGDGWDGRVSTLASGAELVENPATGLWRDGETWRVEEELRIGAAEGDGPDVFSVVLAFDVDDAGQIYAFDTMSRELRVFGPDGAFRRSYGRQGGGPGEFEAVVGLRVGGEQDVWLVDMQNARYTVLREDSAAMYQRPAGMYRPPWIGGFTSDGTFHDIAALRDGEIFVRVAADGQVRDSVRLPQPELRLPRRGSMTFDLPFGPQHLRAFDEAGYLWTAVTHEYRLHRVSLDGDTSLVVTVPRQARPLDAAERDSVASYARLLENELRITVASDMLPREGPVLDWLALDDAGHVWAGLVTPDDAPSAADVFTPDGRYLGRVVLPFTAMRGLPPRFRDGRLYTMAHDELGTPIVVRARIDRRGG
jgi:hypothetical protein